MAFRAVPAGRQGRWWVVNAADGGPVDIVLRRCLVDEPPYLTPDGRMCLSLDVSDATGGLDVLRACDAFIGSRASPVALVPLLVVRVAENFTVVTRGQEVDVVLRPTAFDARGYALVLHRIAPAT